MITKKYKIEFQVPEGSEQAEKLDEMFYDGVITDSEATEILKMRLGGGTGVYLGQKRYSGDYRDLFYDKNKHNSYWLDGGVNNRPVAPKKIVETKTRTQTKNDDVIVETRAKRIVSPATKQKIVFSSIVGATELFILLYYLVGVL